MLACFVLRYALRTKEEKKNTGEILAEKTVQALGKVAEASRSALSHRMLANFRWRQQDKRSKRVSNMFYL